ncbi:TniQ family protein [Rhodanobacter sp. FW106-PBR-R2A-1-13]|uniref:TniQ family protein n=1 Tax=Rhodanobacter sp. FW106-PBR-R2A-1-13 TaxID=3454845 RepID=UPI0034E46B88
MTAVSRSWLASFLSSWQSRELGRRVSLNESTLYKSKGAGIFGYGACVEVYVDAVEHAMGVSGLRCCTLIPIGQALNPQAFDSVRSSRAWCEQCFRDDIVSGARPYDRLLWTLRAITRCPEHRVALRTECPACGVAQHFHNRSGDPLLCWKCDSALIGLPSDLRPMPEPPLGERDLNELVEAIASGEQVVRDEAAFHTFQNALFSIVSPVAGIVAGVAKISGSARARGAVVKPSLGTMLRRAQAAGVTVLQILEDPEVAATAAGQLIFDSKAIAARAKIRRPSEIVEDVRNAMLAQLEEPRSVQIRRLAELANCCGVSEGYVRYHLPALVKRYQSHRVAASIFGTQSCLARCKTLLEDQRHIERYWSCGQTKRKLAKLLATDAECNVRVARLAIRRYLCMAKGSRRAGKADVVKSSSI